MEINGTTKTMGCGHSANGWVTRGQHKMPICVICYGINEGADVVVDTPELAGRQSQCSYCKRLRPSSTDLAFFEFEGIGSRWATEKCSVCHMNKSVHAVINPTTGRAGVTDHTFIPMGPREFDSHYDGCQGWD